MEFFEVLKKRRSIRRFTSTKVPDEVIEKALSYAVLAPTSSNGQTWDFYWVKSNDNKKKLIHYCLDQSAARMASDLIVIVASPMAYKRSWPKLVEFVKKIKAPEPVIKYYEKLFPLMYKWGFLNSLGFIKMASLFAVGFFRPIPRGPNTLRDVQEVCIKSAALAAENFVLAITAQNYSTCMMEGFDEVRVKKLLKLKSSDRVVVVIAVGEETTDGTWGPQFRIPLEQVIHRI